MSLSQQVTSSPPWSGFSLGLSPCLPRGSSPGGSRHVTLHGLPRNEVALPSAGPLFSPIAAVPHIRLDDRGTAHWNDEYGVATDPRSEERRRRDTTFSNREDALNDTLLSDFVSQLDGSTPMLRDSTFPHSCNLPTQGVESPNGFPYNTAVDLDALLRTPDGTTQTAAVAGGTPSRNAVNPQCPVPRRPAGRAPRGMSWNW